MIEFLADKVKISGPKIDGSFTISFDTGESFATITDISRLLAMNGDNITVRVFSGDPSSITFTGNQKDTRTPTYKTQNDTIDDVLNVKGDILPFSI